MTPQTKLNKPLSVLATLALVLFLTGLSTSQAGIISVFPDSQTVDLGTSVSVDVTATDLGSIIVSSFDVRVDWNPSILSFSSITFWTA